MVRVLLPEFVEFAGNIIQPRRLYKIWISLVLADSHILPKDAEFILVFDWFTGFGMRAAPIGAKASNLEIAVRGSKKCAN